MCNCANQTKCVHSLGVTRQIVLNNDTIGRDGESAYEIAVRLGFEGTEEEFRDLNENNSYDEFTW